MPFRMPPPNPMIAVEKEPTDELNQPTIGIMVLNFNGEKWLPPLYESIRKQTYPKLKTYLIDNASSDESVPLTLAGYPEVKVLTFSKNAGYCIAYNSSMPIAFKDGCDWVIWANSDVLLEPGCIDEMGRIAAEFHQIGVIGPAFVGWDSNEPNVYMLENQPRVVAAMQQGLTFPIDVDWVEGSLLMVSRHCVEDVGWLDPFLFFYWEEADFCRRAVLKDWRVVLAPRAVARHYGGGSTQQRPDSLDAKRQLKRRNQYVYVLANPNHTFTRNLVECFYLFLVLLKSAFKIHPNTITFEIRASLHLIPELREIWNKWKRDRTGVSPEATTPEYADIRIEIGGNC